MKIGDRVRNIHTGKVNTITKIERVKRAPNDYVIVYELNNSSRFEEGLMCLHFEVTK